MMRLKICGATTPKDVRTAESAGADYIGLWLGVDGHPRNLDRVRFRRCVEACDQAQPVAVCVQSDPDRLAGMLHHAGVWHVQLHGFTTPRQCARFKDHGFTVIKTLHVADDGGAPEEPWIDAYDRAGVDIYLLDRHGADGSIGSAGVALPEEVVKAWAEKLQRRRLWLAGGLTPLRITELRDIDGIEAMDVDSAARVGGRLEESSIALLRLAIGGGFHATASAH